MFDPDENPNTTFVIDMHVSDLLTPQASFYGVHSDYFCYWCSKNSNEQSMTDMLQFELVHPVCLVREVQIEPFTEDPKASPCLYSGYVQTTSPSFLNVFSSWS